MPLSKDNITAVDNLKGLTEEQISAIIALSSNVEQKVIDDTTNRIHSQYDQDVERITGKKKEPTEKSYHHLQNVLTELVERSAGAGKVTELQTQFDTLKKEKDALEAKIKDGVSDPVTKQRIAELEQKLHDKDGELTTTKTTFEQERTNLQKLLQETVQKQTVFELEAEANEFFVKNNDKFQFKTSIPEKVLSEILATRKAQLIGSIKPDSIDDGKGGKRRVFRDDKGEIMRNPNNKLEPYSFGELYFERVADLIDVKGQGGGGTKPGTGGGGTILNLTGAKSQVEADEIIVDHLLKVEGLSKTNPAFAERQTAIRKDHGVDKLPIQ